MESPLGTCCSNKNQAGSFGKYLDENNLHLGRLQDTSPEDAERGQEGTVWKANGWGEGEGSSPTERDCSPGATELWYLGTDCPRDHLGIELSS